MMPPKPLKRNRVNYIGTEDLASPEIDARKLVCYVCGKNIIYMPKDDEFMCVGCGKRYEKGSLMKRKTGVRANMAAKVVLQQVDAVAGEGGIPDRSNPIKVSQELRKLKKIVAKTQFRNPDDQELTAAGYVIIDSKESISGNDTVTMVQ